MPVDPLQKDLFAARRGDRAALDRVLTKLQERLKLIVRAELGTALNRKLQTSDLLQSTYLDVVRCVQDFRGESEEQFLGWFRRILANNIRDRIRYYTAAKRKGGDTELVIEPVDDGPTPSGELRLQDADFLRNRALERAMKQLSSEQQQVLKLRFLEGLSHKEIADRLGKTDGAVRVMVSRARRALAMQFKDFDPDDGDIS